MSFLSDFNTARRGAAPSRPVAADWTTEERADGGAETGYLTGGHRQPPELQAAPVTEYTPTPTAYREAYATAHESPPGTPVPGRPVGPVGYVTDPPPSPPTGYGMASTTYSPGAPTAPPASPAYPPYAPLPRPATPADGWGAGGGAETYATPPPAVPQAPAPAWNQPQSYPPANRRRRSSVLVVGVAAVAAIAIGAGAAVFALHRNGPSLRGLSPSQIMAKSLAAATKAGSVHALGVQSNHQGTERVSIDMTDSAGTAVITGPGGQLWVTVSNGTIYIKASAGALVQDGMSPADAQSFGNQWYTAPPSDTAAASMADEVELPVVLTDVLTLAGVITATPGNAPGTIDLHGTLADNEMNSGSGAGDGATLVVSAKAPFYPISLSYADLANGTTTLTFSNWGQAVAVAPPATPIKLPDSAFSNNNGTTN